MRLLKTFLFVSVSIVCAGAQSRDIRDSDILPGDTVTWYGDTTYILKEKVFVEDGAVLNIQAGTIIKGVELTGSQASALIICRGGKINAVGTQQKPVIFTCVSDNIGNLTAADKGLWGGVIILGKATNNNKVDTMAQGEKYMEGVAPGDPRSLFGGTDDTDNSGILKYVSIRHSGMTIAPENELNGLSLGSVGSGTTLEYVETYASSDDGFEWWGGTVNGKYLISSFCDDDAFDIDCGYRGKLQFIFAIQDSISSKSANWAGEWDGDDQIGATPYGFHTIYNATFIGGGSTANSSNGGLLLRENVGASLYNSILTNFKQPRGIILQDFQNESQDSRMRFEANQALFKNNIFWNFGSATMIDSIVKWTYKATNGSTVYELAESLKDSVKVWKNTYEDPKINMIAYGPNGNLDPTLQTSSPAFSDLAAYPVGDDFITPAVYKGAFGSDNWSTIWTGLWDENSLAEVAISFKAKPKKVISGFSVTMGKNTIALRLALKTKENVSAVLYTPAGKRVATLTSGVMEAGPQLVSRNITLSRGTYLLKLTTSSASVVKEIAIHQ